MLKAQQKDLDELLALPGNPKGHDQAGISVSVGEFGFLERIVINKPTGHILSGHGRVASLKARRDAGEDPPENVGVTADGHWMVPVDIAEVPEGREMAAAIALNRWTERGGWDDAALLAALRGIGTTEEDLRGVGFDKDDIDSLTAFAQFDKGSLGGGDSAAAGAEYTPPPKAPRLIVYCETEEQVQQVAKKLGIAYQEGRVTYPYAETALGQPVDDTPAS